MCNGPFCHLHNHSEYSLLDGANRTDLMVKHAADLGMDALAISDHGVMFGVMEFYMAAKKQGIKPILGMEAYVAPQGIEVRNAKAQKELYHLLLLAKDLDGYRNLCKLSTVAALEGFYVKPRIDHRLLRDHAKGLIATTTCLGSEVNDALMQGDYERAKNTAAMYREMFDEGSYFVELQDHGIAEQRLCNEGLIKIAKELSLPLIVTNDAHYMCRADAKPHDVLLCIQTGKLVADENRMKFSGEEFYLKSPQEMASLFPDHPEAIENTMRIAEMCNVELDKRRAPMPQPMVPAGMENFGYLRQLAEEGLKDRMKDPERALDRLNYELDVIGKTGFGDYFLLVREVAATARSKGIQFGVRGSAAGSLVSYCIGITDVDPVEYGLTFERFLNPERISMPDVDMDFEDARRQEIIDHVQDRFGKDRVAQIVTFGTLGAKAAIKDCGRVLGYAPADTDRLTKTIPTLPGWTLDRAYDELPEFRGMIDADPRLGDLFQTAKSVEGMARNAGVHAAGVVISSEPLVDYVPLTRGTDGQPVTAYDMGILEKIGMLKMDFLGLSNLTVLARCLDNIEAQTGERLDVLKLPEDDPKAYEKLGKGETVGVFQLEGGGMTRWVQQLKPTNVRELAAMIALYRPGPMEHIPRFIDTKFGKLKPKYPDERMEPILRETYGVIVYQDQVMELVRSLAGFSLGKADVLRRAMGKKDAKAMAEMKSEYDEGCLAGGVDPVASEEVWELLKPFAGYAFNKAHAVCYSILAYQTAYLKAHYPVAYMAALLSVYLDKEDKVTTFIEECRRLKIPVMPPDVNRSGKDFCIERGPKGLGKKGEVEAIRFGMLAIKGVGEGVVDAIIAERAEGDFRHLYEFAERTKSGGMNKIALEALVKAGALDSIDTNRRKLLQHVDGALSYAEGRLRAKMSGQGGLFGGESDDAGGGEILPVLPDLEPFSRTECLAMEKEVMGIYVSDHPMRGYERQLQALNVATVASAREMEDGSHVKLAGVLTKVTARNTKAGDRMAIIGFEDFSGTIEGLLFPKAYERCREALGKDGLVQIAGYVSHREMRGEKEISIRVEAVEQLVLAERAASSSNALGTVEIRVWRATEAQMRRLREVISAHPGAYELVIAIQHPGGGATPVYLVQHVDPSEAFVDAVRHTLLRADVEVRESDSVLSR